MYIATKNEMQNDIDLNASHSLSAAEGGKSVYPDRTAPPPVQPTKFTFCQPTKRVLRNGVPVYIVEAPTLGAVRVDFVFHAGMWHQSRKLQSLYACNMLREGCKGYSAAQFAERIDYYGAGLSHGVVMNRTYVSLFTLRKHFESTLDLVHRMITTPAYDESRLRTACDSSKARLLINLKKGDVVAQRILRREIYGEDHPSGYQLYPDDYDTLHAEHLRDYHARYYSSGPNCIYISGEIDDAMIDSLETLFGGVTRDTGSKVSLMMDGQPIPLHWNRAGEIPVGAQYIPASDAVQDNIRLGCPLMDVGHIDYAPMRMLTTVLGGYFGSRLMKNVREERGHTYHIGANIVANIPQTLFMVHCDAHAGKAREVLDEVYKEMYRLQNELISADELRMVRNYMTGEICRDYENAFDLIGAYFFMERLGLPFSHLDHVLDAVQNTTAERLQQLAQQYLKPESMYAVVVEGGKG